MKLGDAVVQLYRKAATETPPDVVESLKSARENEDRGSLAHNILGTILENIELARKEGAPICQDTGTPIFRVSVPKGTVMEEIKREITEGTRRATKEIPLRPNAVDSLSGKNSSDNVGRGSPVMYIDEWGRDHILVELMLKGGGCENIGQMYSLPNDALNAGRSMEGVRKCVIDAVMKAQGKGCPPEIVGVCIGGNRSMSSKASSLQLFRKIDDKNPDTELDKFEKKLCVELNTLGIGPMGLGGKTTVLGVKVTSMHRHPASFFLDVSFSCWATRRASMEYRNGELKWLK